MAETTTTLSPFLSSIITLLFVFSTIYTLAFFYYQGAGQVITFDGLSEDAVSSDTVNFLGMLDGIINFISWISPFALVRGILFYLAPADLYQVLDMLLLRPISWIVSIITVNFIISKIPTISGET